MAIKRPPAFQFYPADFLASQTQASMTVSEAGIYIRLLCHCWLEGSLPADSPSLARLAAVKDVEFDDAEMAIRKAFRIRKKDGRLFHTRLDRERRKQLDYRKLQQIKGFKGGRPRKPVKSRSLAVVKPDESSSVFSLQSSTSVEDDCRDASLEADPMTPEFDADDYPTDGYCGGKAMNISDLDPNIEEAWKGRELKVCANPVECCKELSRVWLALGDGAIKRPYLGSVSERVKKLRTENASIRAAVRIIVKGFDDGVFVRSTAQDQNPKWAVELLPYIQALQQLKAVK